jgi:hypothetical protein
VDVTDWHAWHRDYDDPGSDLSRRRRSVEARIEAWLDEHPATELQVVSACSGDGRDILEVLARRPSDAARVQARLLELDDDLADAARRTAAAHDLRHVDVRREDAGRTGSYDGAVPADLVMWCGVFGNLSEDDVRRTIATTRCLAAPGATVVWTRGCFRATDGDDPVERIRGWFATEGFEELHLDAPADATYRVGVHRLVAEPVPLGPDRTFFTFQR